LHSMFPIAPYAESRAELWAKGATLEVRQDRMVLRPSVGVVEASDYLSHKHDWVQTVEETTHEMRRLVYTPASVGRISMFSSCIEIELKVYTMYLSN